MIITSLDLFYNSKEKLKKKLDQDFVSFVIINEILIDPNKNDQFK